MLFNVERAATAVVLLSAVAPVSSAVDANLLDSDAGIKKTAGVLAADVIQRFKSMERKVEPGIMVREILTKDELQKSDGDKFRPYIYGNSAFVWYSMIQYGRYTGDETYNDQAAKVLNHWKSDKFFVAPFEDFVNEPNRDQPLWGLAVMAAAECGLTGGTSSDQHPWYKLAERVFGDIAARWDEKNCSGGMWDVNGKDNPVQYWQKSSRANGLLFNLAARLARYTGEKKYTDWAVKIWNWLEETGLIDESYVVYTSFGETDNCHYHVFSSFDQQWSHDNALLTEGSAYLYSATGDSMWKKRVDGLVKTGLETFTKDDKMLIDTACIEDYCPLYTPTYKGFFHHSYAQTAQLIPDTADAIMPKLSAAAKAALKTCKGEENGPMGCALDSLRRDTLVQAEVMDAVSTLLMDSSKLPLRASKHDKAGADDKDTKFNDKDSKDSSANLPVKGSFWGTMALAVVMAVVMI